MSSIQIDIGEAAEIDRIGTGDERAVVMVGIKNLHGQRFPSAGGAAVHEARPALADAAELFLNRGNQLGFDGVAVGAEVGGIDRVGIVVIGIGMIDLRDQEARESRRDPMLIELVGFFLLDAVVTGNVKAFAVIGLQIGVGRSRCGSRAKSSLK